MDNNETINELMQKVGMIIDTNGLSRTMLVIEIMQMVNALGEKIREKEEQHKKEKEELMLKLEAAESLLRSEKNQNGRTN